MALEAEQVYIKNRPSWRKWLIKNHQKVNAIWLVYDKVPNRNLSYADMVEEALCFGWIDSTVRSLSETQSQQYMCQRKKGSVWSALNKQRIAKLLAENLMMPAGLAKVEMAKADGTWNILDDVENLVMPPDLGKALSSDRQARANFNNFTVGARKNYLYWLHFAKREETRRKRIAEIVSLARQNIKSRQDGW